MKTATKPHRPLPTVRVSDLPKSDLLPPAGRRLMAKALTAMVRYPETVDMDVFIIHDHDDIKHKRKLPRPFCGTVACLAGHICLAAGTKPTMSYSNNFDAVAAAKKLGVNYESIYQIFSYEDTRTHASYPDRPAARARAVVARVKHWLRTGE